MTTPFNAPIIQKQLTNLLAGHGIPHDMPPSIVAFKALDDGVWHVEYKFSGVRVPIYIKVVKSFLDLPGEKRIATFKVGGLNLGGTPEWLAEPKADETPVGAAGPQEPPKLAAVPEPEE